MPLRILIFYVLTLLVIMSLYPWYLVSEGEPLFVQIFEGLGIPCGRFDSERGHHYRCYLGPETPMCTVPAA